MEEKMSELIEEMRAGMKKSDDERDALFNTPEDVERWDNIVYGHTVQLRRAIVDTFPL